jgi:hypothetical protein
MKFLIVHRRKKFGRTRFLIGRKGINLQITFLIFAGRREPDVREKSKSR